MLCPCKSGRRRWWSVVSCYKLVTSYSSLCQIKVNVSNWKVKPFNFSALSIIKRRFALWWHCLSWHIIMILFKSLFNYCGVVVIEMWNFQNTTYKKLWKSQGKLTWSMSKWFLLMFWISWQVYNKPFKVYFENSICIIIKLKWVKVCKLRDRVRIRIDTTSHHLSSDWCVPKNLSMCIPSENNGSCKSKQIYLCIL